MYTGLLVGLLCLGCLKIFAKNNLDNFIKKQQRRQRRNAAIEKYSTLTKIDINDNETCS